MNHSIKALLENDILVIGISELSHVCDVSPRQLRYWEEKGFIESVEKDGHSARKYRLQTVLKVESIKRFIDEGYKLAVAVQKADKKIENIRALQNFAKQSIRTIDFEDDESIHVTLGHFEDNQEDIVLHYDKETQKMTYETKRPFLERFDTRDKNS